MADFVKVPIASGGSDPKIKTRTDSAGNEWQTILLAHGAVNSESIVSSASPLPVTVISPTWATDTVLQAVRDRLPTALVGGKLSVDATSSILATDVVLQAIRDRMPSALTGEGRLKVETQAVGGGTSDCQESTQLLVKAAVEAMNTKTPALVSGQSPVLAAQTGTWTVTGPLTDAQLRATAVPISGTVTATGPLTDGQLRATAVPVSGPLTDAQLRASTVPISGTVTATGPLTDGQLRATAVPVSGPLTDAQLRASTVPISGTVTASGPLTDAQLRATSVPVSGPLTDAQIRADCINVAVATGAIYSGTTKLAPKFAAINTASSGNTTLVAAVSGKKIKVIALFLMAAGTVNATIQSGAGGTALTGAMPLVANAGFVLPFNVAGWFETASATLLNINLSAAIQVSGSLVYIEE